LNVFFDNNTAPVLASTLNGFISHQGHKAFHIRDVPGLPNGRHSTDIEWIDHLRRSPDVWIFVSFDGRILKNKAERAALRSAGLHGFLLASALQKSPLNQVAAALLLRWPEIVQVVGLVSAPAMHEIPVNRGSKLKQVPF
jgi:hypothetical protein